MVTRLPNDSKSGARRAEEGYNLVVLVVAITLLHIALAASMPLWSTAIQREKEAEAIFRGLQYAEAIRVFQQRFGRYPTNKEELLEMEPRSIRQLWTDPLSKGGELGFGTLVAAGTRALGDRGRGASRTRGGEAGLNASESRDRSQPTRTVVTAPAQGRGQQVLVKVAPGAEPPTQRRRRRADALSPMRGVYLATEGEAIRSFFGAEDYSEWVFTDTLIPVPSIVNPEGPLPSANSDRIGRPFDVALPEARGLAGDDEDDDRGNRNRRRRRRASSGGDRE